MTDERRRGILAGIEAAMNTAADQAERSLKDRLRRLSLKYLSASVGVEPAPVGSADLVDAAAEYARALLDAAAQIARRECRLNTDYRKVLHECVVPRVLERAVEACERRRGAKPSISPLLPPSISPPVLRTCIRPRLDPHVKRCEELSRKAESPDSLSGPGPFTYQTAAKVLDVTERWIRKLVQTGKLVAVGSGQNKRITAESLRRYAGLPTKPVDAVRKPK